MIKLQGVSKFYKTKTGVSEGMRNVNLDFKLNEFVAITGESGSGKTTLLNVISGLDSYEDGELFVNGLETSHYTVKEWEEFRAKYVGFVFQNYNVIDSYSVYQNVLIALEAQGYNESDKKERALDLIEKVGLLSHKNQKTAKLSGGQKQRVVIARALAKNAPIILADEPTGNLDEKSGIEIMKLLKEISKDKLVILVTHNFEEAKPYVTRNIVMSDGNIKDDKIIDKSNIPADDLFIEVKPSTESSLKISSKIASRNIAATPKRTVFSVLLSMLAITVFIMFYGMLIKNQQNVDIYSSHYVVVENRDDSYLSKTDIDYFMEFENKHIDVELLLPSKVISAGLKYPGENDFYFDISFSVNVAKEPSSYDHFYGNLPKYEDEVVISNEFDISIGDKIKVYFNNDDTFKEFIVSGIFGFQLSSDGYRYDGLYFKESYIYDEEYNLNSEIFEDIATFYNLKVSGSDRQEVEIFKKKIDADQFRIIDDYLITAKNLEVITSFLSAIYWMLLLSILSIVFLVLFHIFKNIMESRKKDFAVYRSIGISEKEVGYTILIEQLIIALIAAVITITILEIASTQVEFIRLIIRHINILDYLLVSVIFAVFSLILGLRFNKRIFKVTVIDSLKEDN